MQNSSVRGRKGERAERGSCGAREPGGEETKEDRKRQQDKKKPRTEEVRRCCRGATNASADDPGSRKEQNS